MLGEDGASKLEMRRVELSMKGAVLVARRPGQSEGRRHERASRIVSDETHWGDWISGINLGTPYPGSRDFALSLQMLLIGEPQRIPHSRWTCESERADNAKRYALHISQHTSDKPCGFLTVVACGRRPEQLRSSHIGRLILKRTAASR